MLFARRLHDAARLSGRQLKDNTVLPVAALRPWRFSSLIEIAHSVQVGGLQWQSSHRTALAT